jgi:radical SAM superfamily enzyme YgiQ (UPF0313 family)
MHETTLVLGVDSTRAVDAVFVNSPLKNYDLAPRHNDYTLPVLGLAYIATYARSQGFNVGVLDAEALGLGISRVATILNALHPRWVGLNLLAPTYQHSVRILQRLDPELQVLLGGHHAKAMPGEILRDSAIPRIDALVLGEGEYRVAALLGNRDRRTVLPHVLWRDHDGVHTGTSADKSLLAPDVDTLPFVSRDLLRQDPFLANDGRIEANLVGSRGCPYDCAFCGAARSANPDVSVRTRQPENLLAEMEGLARDANVTAFRFVDDLFLANPAFMRACLSLFIAHGTGERFVWDATGRINTLSTVPDDLLALMRAAGCREVALGIESGSDRLLRYMDKHITAEMARTTVRRLTTHGMSVKGYFILGYPTETRTELQQTVDLIRSLWATTEHTPGSFRCSTFEFRPYPGTPEWHRLLATGYAAAELLQYEHADLTSGGQHLLDRDEFNFSVNRQFGEATVTEVRTALTGVMTEQHQRVPQRDHVQRLAS